MAGNNSFDCSATDLFCNEETKGLGFDDDDDDNDLVGPFNDQCYQSNGGKGVITGNVASDSEAQVGLPCLSEECIGWMVEREREHLPRDDYLMRLRSGELDNILRRVALDWMFKACGHHGFGELCLYSAMSYFDRFLSVYELPICSLQRGDRKWAVQLVSVACLSLAAKIEEVNVPSIVDLQAWQPKFLFNGKNILRMELLVSRCLNWKIKAYTPCSFIDYFLKKMNDGEFPPGLLIRRSLQIIMSTIEGIDFLEFKPSEIAAAVAICVSGEIQTKDIDKTLSCFIHVEKGRVVKCLKLIQDLVPTNGVTTTTATITTIAEGIATSVNVADGLVSRPPPHSPNGVLEAACLSYRSDERTVGSGPSSSHSSPETKRRKMDQRETFGSES